MTEESKLGDYGVVSGVAELSDGTVTLALPISIIFEPLQDITAYELALVLNYKERCDFHSMLYEHDENDWNTMPEGVRRHFRRVA